MYWKCVILRLLLSIPIMPLQVFILTFMPQRSVFQVSLSLFPDLVHTVLIKSVLQILIGAS